MRYAYDRITGRVVAKFEVEKDAINFIGSQENLSNNSAYQLSKTWGYPKNQAGVRQIERDLSLTA